MCDKHCRRSKQKKMMENQKLGENGSISVDKIILTRVPPSDYFLWINRRIVEQCVYSGAIVINSCLSSEIKTEPYS